MFEKEAEEYGKTSTDSYKDGLVDIDDISVLNEAITEGFKDGAEFGYNKANEWHYVKDGDLPKTHGWYLVQYNDCAFDCVVVTKDLRFVNFDTFKDMTETVYAWKEIVLPKECE